MTNFASPVRAARGRVNLIPNPQFELGTTAASTNFVSASSDLVVGVSTTVSRRGTNSMSLGGIGTNAAGSVVGYSTTGALSNVSPAGVAVTGGVSYTFSIWARVAGTTRNLAVQLYWLNANGSNAGNNNGANTALNNTGWTFISITATAPATAVAVIPRLNCVALSTGETIYVDSMGLEPATTAAQAQVYFDGTVDGARWTGTAHNSASESFGFDGAGSIVQNVSTPVLGTDAVNKTYADALLSAGLRATAATTRYNLVSNPSFTSTANGWVSTAPGSIAQSASVGFSGTGVLSLATTTAGTAVSAWTQAPVTGATQYTFSVYVASGSMLGTVTLTPKIEWYSLAGALLSTSTGTTVATLSSTTTGFTRLIVSGAGGATAGMARLIVQSGTFTSTSDTVFIDAALFEASFTAGAYFDGSTTRGRWLGTAQQSVSELVSIDANSTTVAGVLTPALSTDAANKAYVDSATSKAGLLSTGKRTNLVTNPSFESNVTGWTASSGTLARNGGVWGALGTNSHMRLTTTAGATVTITSAIFPTQSGIDHVMSFYSRAFTTAATLTATLTAYTDAAATTTASTYTTTWTDSVDTNGLRVQVGGTMSNYARLVISYTPAGATSEIHGFDAFLFESQSSASNAAGEYFDGSMAGNRWTGSAHASTSETAINANSTPIVNVPSPSLNGDAANKAYVDSTAAAVTSFSKVNVTGAYNANLVTNPGFNTIAVLPWTASSGSTVINAVNSTATAPYEGAYCMSIVTTASTSPVIVSGSMAVTAGVTYTASCYVKTAATGRTYHLDIYWYSAAGVQLSVTTGTSGTDTTAWGLYVTAGAVAPAGAASARLVGVFSAMSSAETHYVDAFMFEAAAARTGYFDGDSPGWHWTGTAGASISETQNFSGNNNPLNFVGSPLVGTDAANRTYVDSVISTHVTHPRLVVSSAGRANLMVNSGFNTGASTGWVGGNATLQAVTTTPYEGAYCLSMTSTSSTLAPSVASPPVNVTAGANYAASAYIRTSSPTRTARVDIAWYSINGTLLSSSVGSPVTDSITWSVYLTAATAPVGAVTAKLLVTWAVMSINETHFVDAVMFEAGSSRTTYADGDTAGWRYLGANGAVASSELLGFDAGANPVTNVGLPSLSTDAASKGYVDNRSYQWRYTTVLATQTTVVSIDVPSLRNVTLKWHGRSSDTTVGALSDVFVRINNYSAANYNTMFTLNNNGSTSGLALSPVTYAFGGSVSNSVGGYGYASGGRMEFYGSDTTLAPTVMTFTGQSYAYATNTLQKYTDFGGSVFNQSTIVSIQIQCGTGNWVAGSQFTVIGE